MNILHFNLSANNRNECLSSVEIDRRYERDIVEDMKHGLDLIFELKNQIDKLHPFATETLIRMCSM